MRGDVAVGVRAGRCRELELRHAWERHMAARGTWDVTVCAHRERLWRKLIDYAIVHLQSPSAAGVELLHGIARGCRMGMSSVGGSAEILPTESTLPKLNREVIARKPECKVKETAGLLKHEKTHPYKSIAEGDKVRKVIYRCSYSWCSRD